MRNKIKLYGIVFLILLLTVSAQETFVSTSTIEAQITDPSIKISFRSWEEGTTTELRLDDYFLGERSPNDRYLYITPSEIEVSIDQETSIAVLKARGKWLGAKDIIFTRSSLYNLERTRKELKKFEFELVKERVPPQIKNELVDIKDVTIQEYLERIIDNIESKKSKDIPEIKASFNQNKLEVGIGKDIDLNVGVETSVQGAKTRKPSLELNVRPGETQPQTEEEELSEGFPILLLFPIFLIGGTLLIALGVFIFRNPSRIKKLIPTIKPTTPEIINRDLLELEHYKTEIKSIERGIDKIPLKATSEKIFALIKNFFNNITHSDYEFTYSEVTKDILEEQLNKETKDFLIKFSKEIEDFKYSNKELTKEGLLNVIKKTQKGILLSIKDISRVKTKEEIKFEDKKPVTHFIISLRNYFSSGDEEKTSFNIFKKIFSKKKLSSKSLEKIALKKLEEKSKEKTEKKISLISFFHDNFGLFKTSEEKEKEAQEKLDEEKLKLKIIEEKRKARRKAVIDFFHNNFGLFKTKQEIEKENEEKLRLKKEKEKLLRQLEAAKTTAKRKRSESIKGFFHTYFGLFKTQKEIEAEVKTRLEERKKAKLERKRTIIKFFHDNFGLFKTKKEIENIEKEKEQLRLEKLRLKQKITREKTKARLAKRKAVIDFFHDNFGLFKTPEEKEQIIRLKLEEKRKKSEERRKAIFSFFHDTLGIKTREELEEKKLKEGKLKLKVLKEKRRIRLERQKTIRKFLHDNFGFYKTQEEKERLALEKLRLKHEKSKERRKAFIKFCHDKLGLFKTEKEVREENEKKLRLKEKLRREKIKAKIERKIVWKRFFHNHLGWFKTQEELKKIKELKEKEKLKKLHNKLVARERNKKAFITFLHDKLGLFKTLEERTSELKFKEQLKLIKLKEKEQEKIKRIELKNKIIEKSSFLKRLFGRSIKPEDELHILIRMEEEAIRAGDIKKAKDLKNKINKIYSSIKFHKEHPKLAGDYDSIKNKLFSLTNKVHDFEKKEKGKSFFEKIKSLFSQEIDKNSIDEIRYLIKKCEAALTSNQKKLVQELYLRIINIFKRLNRASKREIQEEILSLRTKVAGIAVKEALEEAHKALLSGKTKEAKKLYERVKDNFYYLNLKQRENLLQDKTELAQKLQETKTRIISIPRIPLPEFDIITLINLQKEKFSEKYNQIKQNVLRTKPVKIKTYKEPLKNYLTAQKPKFTSIKVDTIPLVQKERIKKRKINELNKHLSSLKDLVYKKEHDKAVEKYKEVVEFFKDHSHDLPEEMHNLVYTTLKPIKQKILNISLKNLLPEMQQAIKEGEHETAKELKEKISAIHTHLTQKVMLPFTPPQTKFSEIRKLIKDANNHLDNNHLDKAKESYNKINNLYQELTPQQKQLIYGKILYIYRKLM